MNNETELQERIRQLMSDNAKMAGQMSAICGYLDSAGVPKVSKIHKRVKLLTILNEQTSLESKRLALLLDELGDK